MNRCRLYSITITHSQPNSLISPLLPPLNVLSPLTTVTTLVIALGIAAAFESLRHQDCEGPGSGDCREPGAPVFQLPNR